MRTSDGQYTVGQKYVNPRLTLRLEIYREAFSENIGCEMLCPTPMENAATQTNNRFR